jgi:thiamine-phosphate pyrophosphorylase
MKLTDELDGKLLRVNDACLNRVAEGLRYLEDVSRFLLNDIKLNQRLKTIRHELVVTEWQFQKNLIDARDASADVGKSLEVSSDKETPRDLPSSIVANARRVQEALRTLEELSKVKTITPGLTGEKLQKTRFELYTIEKEILGKLLRQEQTKRVHGVYVVIDTQALKGRSHVDMTLQVIRGGAKIIQLRDKTMDRGQLLPIARELKDLCAWSNAIFIMNDYLDVALAVNADGLHLGQSDMPVNTARSLAPMDMIIGCSANTPEEALRAQADGADYVAVGAIYPTSSKESAQPVGVGVIRLIKRVVTVPLVAIGGIGIDNIPELKAAGIDSIAVISAVLGAESPESATRQLIHKFEVENGKTDR